MTGSALETHRLAWIHAWSEDAVGADPADDVEGTLELRPVDDGCVNEVRLVVDCGIPFVGKALAEFVAADCRRLITREYEYITDRLGRA